MSSTVSAFTPAPDPTSAAWSTWVDNQNFTLVGLNGTTTTFSMPLLNASIWYWVSQAAFYSFSIGATGVMIFVLLILTGIKKAQQPLFIINFSCLVLHCVQNIMGLCGICKIEIYGFSQEYLDALLQYPKSQYVWQLVALDILTCIFYGAFLTSLILHVRCVFSAQPLTQRVVTILFSLFAVAIVAFWTTFQIIYIVYTLEIF
jgi:Fungal pheromone mating factor STE2 GPCR